MQTLSEQKAFIDRLINLMTLYFFPRKRLNMFLCTAEKNPNQIHSPLPYILLCVLPLFNLFKRISATIDFKLDNIYVIIKKNLNQYVLYWLHPL